METRSSLKKIMASVLLAVILSVTLSYNYAYAGTSDSYGSGYSGSGSGGHNAYITAKDIKWHPWNSYIKGEIGGSAANADIGVYLTCGYYSKHDWTRWNKILHFWYFGYGGGHSGSNINMYKGWDGRLNEERLRNGYEAKSSWVNSKYGQSNFWWFAKDVNGGPVLLDACWIEERTIEEDDPKEVITKTDGGDGSHIDDRDKSAEWLYNNGKVKDEYHDKTKPQEYTHKSTISATIQVVNKHTKIKQKIDQNGNWYDISREVSYSKQGVKKFTKDINYSVKTPTISQEYYKPFNLNRNGYATSEDLSGQFTKSENTGLDATVDNQQGIKDNKFINALDINSDTNFTFKFNNNSFGMPDKYNWKNIPDELTNGAYEEVKANSNYANDRNKNADPDGMLRYNLTFNASLTTNSKNNSVDSSSLKLKGDTNETLASKLFTKKLDLSPFTGGEWSTRFTYADKYYTDNGFSDKFDRWWLNTYSQGRFYEYGTEFWGTITTQGIDDPYKFSHGTGESKSDGSYKIITDSDKQQRGLYVGLASQKYDQPVLIGKWEVKTVAGDIN